MQKLNLQLGQFSKGKLANTDRFAVSTSSLLKTGTNSKKQTPTFPLFLPFNF